VTAALVVLTATAAAVTMTMTVSAVMVLRHGSARYAVLVMTWGATLVGSDLTYAAIATDRVDPVGARAWLLGCVLLFAATQLLLTRTLYAPQWVELNLDAYLISVGVVLVGWTVAIVGVDNGVPDASAVDVVYVCSAALVLGLLHRQVNTLALPDLLGTRLLVITAALRMVGIGVLVLGELGYGLSVVAGLLLIAWSNVLMLATVIRMLGVQAGGATLPTSRVAANLPYVVVLVAAPVAVTGISMAPGLRNAPFVGLCAVLAVTLCARQIQTANAHDRLVTQLADRERLYRSLVQDSSDVTMIVTPDGMLDFVSPAALRVLGRSAESVVGECAATVLGVRRADLEAATRRVLATGSPERLESRRGVGASSIVLESVLSRRDDRLLINVRDVSERAEMREQLHHMAYHDELTGLPNWHRMHEEITSALNASAPRGAMAEPALLFVDLDRFKSVNDAAGHAAGDAVLRIVADRLRAVVPKEAILGRVGGDEFLVLLPGGKAGRRELVAHDIARVMARPCETDHGSFAIGASVGIAPASGALDADDLLRHADLAMYAAKRELRPWQAYEPRLHEAAVARAAQDRTYSSILDQHRLTVVFQPVVDIGSGAPVGCEALLRWQDPDGLLGEPGGLLEYAARTGRMYDLSVWVLRAALDEAARWRDLGTAIPVAVNLSSGDVLHPDLPRLILAELGLRGLAPSALGLEITEQVLLGDPLAAMRVCAELRALGVIVAIDDFGTGFSSLAYLVDLPVDVLKIDQSFIHSLTRGGSAGVVVEAVVHMARELGLYVVAEGIETEEQRRLAVKAGVGYGQGYLFSGELTGEEMSDMVIASPPAARMEPQTMS